MKDYMTWKRSYLSPSALNNYERWVNRFNGFTKKDMRSLSLDDIALFKEFLRQEGYSPKNIQYGLSIIRDYIGYNVTVYGIPFPLKLFKIKVERANSHLAITQEEYKRLLAVCDSTIDGLQHRLILKMLWDTGVRIGELMALRVDALSKREAFIENEKNHKRRLISWSEETNKILKIFLSVRDSDSPYLFSSIHRESPKPLTHRTVQILIKELSRKANLERKLSPHSFRHGFVHRQLSKGVPLTTVAQMLGHSTSLNVLTYHQLSSKEIRDAWGI